MTLIPTDQPNPPPANPRSLYFHLPCGPYLFAGLTTDQANHTRELFGAVCTDADAGGPALHAAAHIQINRVATLPPYSAPASHRLLTCAYEKDRILITGRGFTATIDLAPQMSGEIRTDIRDDDHPSLISRTVIDNVLRHLVAYRLHAHGGLLLHSGCVVHAGKAHVFLGRSEAGKSTASALCRDRGFQILNDDLNMLVAMDGGFRVFSYPLAGNHFTPDNLRHSAPLHAFYILEQSHETALQPAKAARTVGQILVNAWVLNEDTYRTEPLFTTISSIVSSVPSHVLRFRLDSDLATLLLS